MKKTISNIQLFLCGAALATSIHAATIDDVSTKLGELRDNLGTEKSGLLGSLKTLQTELTKLNKLAIQVATGNTNPLDAYAKYLEEPFLKYAHSIAKCI